MLAEELNALSAGLANYKRPVGFDLWPGEELPKTTIRKIKRLEVRKWLLEQPVATR